MRGRSRFRAKDLARQRGLCICIYISIDKLSWGCQCGMIISVCLCLIKYFFADVIVGKSSQVKPSQANSSQVNDSPQEILLKKEKEA
jgi:hypothetical protein